MFCSFLFAEEAEKARKLERERELAKVKVERADVELIMTGFQVIIFHPVHAAIYMLITPNLALIFLYVAEMEVDEGKAERILRENNGDPIAALRAMINGR